MAKQQNAQPLRDLIDDIRRLSPVRVTMVEIGKALNISAEHLSRRLKREEQGEAAPKYMIAGLRKHYEDLLKPFVKNVDAEKVLAELMEAFMEVRAELKLCRAYISASWTEKQEKEAEAYVAEDVKQQLEKWKGGGGLS